MGRKEDIPGPGLSALESGKTGKLRGGGDCLDGKVEHAENRKPMNIFKQRDILIQVVSYSLLYSQSLAYSRYQ